MVALPVPQSNERGVSSFPSPVSSIDHRVALFDLFVPYSVDETVFVEWKWLFVRLMYSDRYQVNDIYIDTSYSMADFESC